VIARVWRGWTSRENAEPYERFLRDRMFPSIHRIPGFRGAELLRHDAGDEVAFMTITRFDSLEAVRAFAGDDSAKAVIEPEAKALLARLEERAELFELVIEDR
jgi:heme-degrading monooxygenase HmoA